MAQDTRMPPDPGVVRARQAAPDPTHARPEPPSALTPADAAGERVRDEHPPERSGPVTPAPPLTTGADVNDVDSLEEGVDRFLGEPSDERSPRR